MDNDSYMYVTWQCLLVLICGVVGLIGVFIATNLPQDVSTLFAFVFILCIIVALFFLVWIRDKKRQEKEDSLIDSIGSEE